MSYIVKNSNIRRPTSNVDEFYLNKSKRENLSPLSSTRGLSN